MQNFHPHSILLCYIKTRLSWLIVVQTVIHSHIICLCLKWYTGPWAVSSRFNKIANWRINTRWQVDKETRWHIQSSTYLSNCIPPVWGILALLTPTQSADNMFQSFTVLCYNYNVIKSSLHCFFVNVTSCSQVFLSSLTDKKYLCKYFHTHSIF